MLSTCRRWGSRFFSSRMARAPDKLILNHALLRHTVETARIRTGQLTGVEMSVILPYGYEILGSMPGTRRHYPAIGFPPDMPRSEQEKTGMQFAQELLNQLKINYLDLSRRIRLVGIHGNGFISIPQAQFDDLSEAHLMFIEIFSLSPSLPHILDHYANYIVCLFGSIRKDNTVYPQLRDFENSKTRRNRLFQEFVMIHKIFTRLFGNQYPFTGEQKKLMGALFQELRIQNFSELIPEIPKIVMPVTPREMNIRSGLILPQILKMQAFLNTRPQPLVQISSLPYYNGGEILTTQIGEQDYQRVIEFVKETYHNYPRLPQPPGQNAS